MQRSRTAVLAASFAALIATAHPASAEQGVVVRYGHESGGVCFFDTAYEIPARTSVRADDLCRLLASPAGDGGTSLQPQPTTRPKVRDDGGAPASAPGLPGGAGIDSSTVATATRAAGSSVWELSTTWVFLNTHGQVMYNDVLVFHFTKGQDGSFGTFTPVKAYCATGGAEVFPHQPGVTGCSWTPGIASETRFSFTSRGDYVDTLHGVPFDERTLATTVIYDAWTKPDPTCLVGSLPVGWETAGCQADAKPAP